MYGLVNKAVQDLIVSQFGKQQWAEIKRKANIDIELFVSMSPYPDEVTYKLVSAASEVLGLAPDEILEAFGEYWTVYTAKEGYGEMLDLAGSNLVEFLENLDNLHVRVGLSFTKLKPPSFRCTNITRDSLRLHYYSHRSGLAPFVIGLLKGLGKRFNTEITVSLDRPRGDGQDHDEFLIRFEAP